ncbi:hypothetical protein LCGC14_2005040 [marine sediment metagenome]|uniref:Uncharacterized protein n=1 Tax=marine sediment metagenome TaxID=412755 RepID=A0A0F9FPN4_9ZZZZ
MNKKLTKHVASILHISEDDAMQWIDDDKVIRKWIKSESSTIDRSITKTSTSIDEPIPEGLVHDTEMSDKSSISDSSDKQSINKRSTFLINEKPVRLETVFILWFERTGNNKKKETIERYLEGKTKARKGLKGYLKSASASITDLDTFVLLFNLLLSDKKLALNSNSIKEIEK